MRVKLFSLWQIVKLARMPIVLAVIPFFLVGVLFAIRTGEVFSTVNFLWGLVILFLVEIAASFANDYFDYEADKYNKQFGFSGGSGVLLANPELRAFAKWASILMFVLALLLTSVFVILSSYPFWVIAYIGVAVFFCWFYTAPPLRLVYRGFGEFPHLLAGIMFPGWGYVILTGAISSELLVFSIPFGLLGLTVILNFEIPDREADIHGGKRNLIVRKGRFFSFVAVMMLYGCAALFFLVLAFTSWLNTPFRLWIITLIACVPLLVSSIPVLKKVVQQDLATTYAIRNAKTGFLAVLLITGILLI